jgi:hypothetical protein
MQRCLCFSFIVGNEVIYSLGTDHGHPARGLRSKKGVGPLVSSGRQAVGVGQRGCGRIILASRLKGHGGRRVLGRHADCRFLILRGFSLLSLYEIA